MSVSYTILQLLKRNKKDEPFKKIQSWNWDPEGHSPAEHKVSSLAPASHYKMQIAENLEAPLTLKGITLSASGRAKFVIVKNEVVIATLFSSKDSYNLFYPYPIALVSDDSLFITCINRDYQAQDLYVGFDVE